MTSADDHSVPDNPAPDRPAAGSPAPDHPAPGARSGRRLRRLPAWWPVSWPGGGHPTPPPGVRRRRWGRWLGLGAVALVVSAVIGVTTASAESSLGPHEARYEVTTDSEVTIDLGPFGTLVIDSPLPLTLGARVTVEEIPAEIDALHDVDTLQALSGDLQGYLQFFTGPQATIQDAAWALVRDALARTGVLLAVFVLLGWVARALLGPVRRREILAAAHAHRHQAVAGTLVVVLVGGLATASEAGRARNRVPEGQATAVFDGTPLEGARITGRLGGIIDTYGGLVVQAYRENEDFYARADDALLAAWDEWEAADARGETGDGDGATASPTDGPTPAATDEPTQEPTEEPSAGPTPSDEETAEPVTLLVISDLHCNVGMAPLITTLAERSGAQIVLDAGDTTMNGTSVEQYCVSTIARAVPDGVTLVTAPGNHDSAQTTEQYARAGATVLDGEVIEVAGMRLIGDHDPKVTRVAAETTQDESYPDVAARLRQACEDSDGVDLAMFHNPRIAPAIFEDGCIPAMVSGHMHSRTDPEQVGEGIRYISGSTAGAVDNAPRIGPLRGIAEMTLLRWDPTTRRIIDWQLVEIDPDAQATVHDRERWPVAVPDPDPEADGTGAEPTSTPTP